MPTHPCLSPSSCASRGGAYAYRVQGGQLLEEGRLLELDLSVGVGCGLGVRVEHLYAGGGMRGVGRGGGPSLASGGGSVGVRLGILGRAGLATAST